MEFLSFPLPLINLSFGDSLDRLSVIKVKLKYITDSEKQIVLLRESSLLEQSILTWCSENDISINLFEFHLNALTSINEAGWVQVEKVRECLSLHDSPAINAAHLAMISINDDRIKAKNAADRSVNYDFYEVKSYL